MDISLDEVPIKTATPTTSMDRVYSGAVTGIICRTLCQPLDVIKIRFQLQIEPISRSFAGSKYRGVGHTIQTIFREEGIKSFWKGLVASQFISMVYTPIQFASYHFMVEQSVKIYGISSNNPMLNMGCGSVAGTMAIVAAHPFDTVRTRLVGQGEPKLYNGQLDAVTSILRNEGARGFYRGLIPNVALVGPQAGATFLGYGLCQGLWKQIDPEGKNPTLGSLTSGAISGIFSKSIIYPLDSVKKRLQVQGFEEARNKFGSTRVYTGTVDCVIQVMKEESLRGLYKGYLPSIYKAAIVTALNFALFEYFVETFRSL